MKLLPWLLDPTLPLFHGSIHTPLSASGRARGVEARDAYCIGARGVEARDVCCVGVNPVSVVKVSAESGVGWRVDATLEVATDPVAARPPRPMLLGVLGECSSARVLVSAFAAAAFSAPAARPC